VNKRNSDVWIKKIILQKDVAMATYLLDGGADPNLCEPIVIKMRIIVVYIVFIY
jgi:hypothetical protein